MPEKFVEKFRQGVVIMDRTRADRFFLRRKKKIREKRKKLENRNINNYISLLGTPVSARPAMTTAGEKRVDNWVHMEVGL